MLSAPPMCAPPAHTVTSTMSQRSCRALACSFLISSAESGISSPPCPSGLFSSAANASSAIARVRSRSSCVCAQLMNQLWCEVK